MRLRRVRIGPVVLVSCAFCCAVLLSLQSSKADAHKLFGNMTYLADSSFIEEATFVNGYCEVQEGLLSYSAFYTGHYVFGDFNRDGLKDAAVIISEGEGASRSSRSLAFLINDGKELVHRVSHYLGDRARVNSVKQRGGQVMIDMFVRQEGDCNAWPTKRVKRAYDFLRPHPAVVPRDWS